MLIDVAMQFQHEMKVSQAGILQICRLTYHFERSEYDETRTIISSELSHQLSDTLPEITFYEAMLKVIEDSELDIALGLYQKAEKICLEKGRENFLPRVQNEIGYVYRLKGNYEEAVNYYQKALETARQTGNQYQSFSARIRRAFVRSRDGKYEEGLVDLSEVKKFLDNQDEPDKLLVGEYYSVLGEIKRYRGYNHEAVEAYDSALSQFIAEKALPGIILSQRGVALMNEALRLKRLVRSWQEEEIFIDASEQFREYSQFMAYSTRELIIRILNSGNPPPNIKHSIIDTVHFHVDELIARAEYDLERAVAMCEEANPNALPVALHRYGRVFQNTEQYELALKIFERGRQVSRKNDDYQFIIEHLTNGAETSYKLWKISHEAAYVDYILDALSIVYELETKGIRFPHLNGKLRMIYADTQLSDNFQTALDEYVAAIDLMIREELFVGPDRLDNRLSDIEGELNKLSEDDTLTWRRTIYKAVMDNIDIFSQSQPEVVKFIEKHYKQSN